MTARETRRGGRPAHGAARAADDERRFAAARTREHADDPDLDEDGRARLAAARRVLGLDETERAASCCSTQTPHEKGIPGW